MASSPKKTLPKKPSSKKPMTSVPAKKTAGAAAIARKYTDAALMATPKLKSTRAKRTHKIAAKKKAATQAGKYSRFMQKGPANIPGFTFGRDTM